jgi:hypothetical protein
VKPLLARGNPVQLIDEDGEREKVVADARQMAPEGDARGMPVDLLAIWTSPQTPVWTS